MIESPRIGRLCVITDTVVQNRYSHVELAELAAAGGADTIQLRDKCLGDDELERIARRVLDVCRRFGVLFVVNDRVGVARAVGADGVHLGQTDATVPEARAALGGGAIVGVTAGSVDDALAAEAQGADYIGFGHVFATTSKAKPNPPLGLAVLAGACDAVATPVLAIGGIDPGNARNAVDAGAWGVAVIASVCAAPDPLGAARRIRAALPA